MYPRIDLTNSLSFTTYSICITFAIVSAVLIAYAECKRYGLPVLLFPGAAFWAVLSGIIGAKIFEIIFYEWRSFLQLPLETLIQSGGWMYYGAEIGGVIGLMIYVRSQRINILRPLDIGGLVLTVAHAIGRIGCYCSGCCYGIPTDTWVGVTFPRHSCPVHPTQLYESIPLGIAFIFFWIFRKRFTIPGTVYASYAIFYGVLRFLVEFVRDDGYKMGFLQLSPSQYLSLFFAGAGIGLWRYAWRQHQPQK